MPDDKKPAHPLKQHHKGVLIGGGIAVLVLGGYLLLKHRSATAAAAVNNSGSNNDNLPTVDNPENLQMISSANTNVNGFQNSSYLQTLKAEANLSAAIAALAKRNAAASKKVVTGNAPPVKKKLNPLPKGKGKKPPKGIATPD